MSQIDRVTLSCAKPGPENVVELPVRQLDHYTTPGMPLTALLADSLTKVLDL
ncbi:hypothetical protein Lesp02_30420 [Lentzea sp. NBRC 105346]|uniref:hypothetical protein n=1 Tax=Lentzea sp. NBRC 105346 TaxID=3032205 RepID=UPI0024A4D004|nr:hypothetical protein [Lentzea sp. NBRC 105346]GLZ30853.1 hypothetical protein Lesp02_30420 [Lentzea sp. NBRC 105346]